MLDGDGVDDDGDDDDEDYDDDDDDGDDDEDAGRWWKCWCCQDYVAIDVSDAVELPLLPPLTIKLDIQRVSQAPCQKCLFVFKIIIIIICCSLHTDCKKI